jgi:hypothetical protein
MSYKWSVRLPDNPKAGTLLHPDRELSYAKYKALHFDPNAAVLLAMEERPKKASFQNRNKKLKHKRK